MRLLLRADARSIPLRDESVNCVVTSPPYWGLRDYGVPGQLGLEPTPEEYVASMVEVFREVRRVLRKDGTLWVVVGDCWASTPPGCAKPDHSGTRRHGTRGKQLTSGAHYRASISVRGRKRNFGLPLKNMMGMPWRLASSLQSDGWILRLRGVWVKPNGHEFPVSDRPLCIHEDWFFFSRGPRYYWEGHGLKSVLEVSVSSFKGGHFACFPEDLVRPWIQASSPPGGIVFDPFVGSGTTVKVAVEEGRRGVGMDLSAKYLEMATRRTAGLTAPFPECA